MGRQLAQDAVAQVGEEPGQAEIDDVADLHQIVGQLAHRLSVAAHQHDQNANELWSYFRSIIYWVEDTFTTYRGKLMKGQPWGPLYNTYGADPVDTAALEAEIADLVQDKEVTNNRGIYQYVLSRDPKHLNLRQFDDDQRQEMYERQGGRCANGTKCKDVDNSDGKKIFDIATMDADHIVPWSKGGKTEVSNGQMLCISCNRSKGSL